eukprot:m.240384 g.240384  ORF g.240384 m.240384 type:complete len:243 (+) comp13658_c0_seq1:27-755(+)
MESPYDCAVLREAAHNHGFALSPDDPSALDTETEFVDEWDLAPFAQVVDDLDPEFVLDELRVASERINEASVADGGEPLYALVEGEAAERNEYPLEGADEVMDNENLQIAVGLCKLLLDTRNAITNEAATHPEEIETFDGDDGYQVHIIQIPGRLLVATWIGPEGDFAIFVRSGETRFASSNIGCHPTVSIVHPDTKTSVAMLNSDGSTSDSGVVLRQHGDIGDILDYALRTTFDFVGHPIH